MKYFIRDVLLYVVYGVIMGLVGQMLGVESRDASILAFTAIVLITVADSIHRHFPRR